MYSYYYYYYFISTPTTVKWALRRDAQCTIETNFTLFQHCHALQKKRKYLTTRLQDYKMHAYEFVHA